MSESDAWLESFVYLPERNQSFTNDRCFLCGVQLVQMTRSDEHVFPKWLLNDFDLWNERATLLNRTTIPYRQLVIPCCRTCNNEHLKALEAAVSTAFREGVDAVRALDRDILFLWMGKVFYGLMFRELFLPADRADRSTGSIMIPQVLDQFRMHHLLLQAARHAVRWDTDNHPASVFAFSCQTSTTARLNFDFRDYPFAPFVLAIRCGGVGVVAVLQDWCALQDTVRVPAFEAARELNLHPQQFNQVIAMAIHMASLFNRVPKHVLAAQEDHVQVMTAPLGGLAGGSLFEEFNFAEYARTLADVLGQPVDQIFDGTRVINLLRTEDGALMHIPWDGGHLTPMLRRN